MRDIYSAQPIRAHAYLMEFNTYREGAWLLTGMVVGEESPRGSGVARGLLQRVLDDADKERVPLYLSVEPDGSKGCLTEDQLREWYQRHGFTLAKPDESDVFMVREPDTARGRTLRLLDRQVERQFFDNLLAESSLGTKRAQRIMAKAPCGLKEGQRAIDEARAYEREHRA